MRAKAIVLAVCGVGALSMAVALAQPAHHAPAPHRAPKGGKAVHAAHQGNNGTAEKATSASDKARRSQVVAHGGGITITVGDVEDAINEQSPFLRARYQEPDKLQGFVDDMIRFELLAKEADRRGYGDNPAVVRTAKQNAVQLLIRREFDEKISPQTVSDEDVRAYYEAHKDDFSRPAMVRASHILVATEKEAKELLPKAKASDMAGFRQLASEKSIDTETKDRGGDLRYFTRDGRPPGSQDPPVDPAIVKAAFALENVGDVVARPVPVGDHFSIIKLTDRREGEERSLEQAERSIRLKLWREQRQNAIEAYVDKLRKKYKPEVYPERMRPIQLDTAATSPGFPQQGGPAGANPAP